MPLSAASVVELRGLSASTLSELRSLLSGAAGSGAHAEAVSALERALAAENAAPRASSQHPPAPPPPQEKAAEAELRDDGCVDDEDETAALAFGWGTPSRHSAYVPFESLSPSGAAAATTAWDTAREMASAALETGDFGAAVAALSEGLSVWANPQLFVRRAETLLKLRRPAAALADAAAALELSPGSVRALRCLGRAHRARGEWEKAAASLGEAQAADFDPDIEPLLRLCAHNAGIVQKRRVGAANAAAASAARSAAANAAFAAAKARAAEKKAPPAAAASSASPPPPGVRAIHSEAEWKALVAEGRPIVADYTAAWCGPCKMMAPIFEEVAKAHPGVAFAKIDVDENASLAAAAGVTAMPTFVRYAAGGAKAQTLQGADAGGLKALAAEAAKA